MGRDTTQRNLRLYRFKGPVLISFSGGRTSAFMLWMILRSYGGILPDDVFVVFADTGKEHPKTYDFVKACAEHWGVTIHTVAYEKGEHETPFDALIAKKKYLPNPYQRFCTEHLKVLQLAKFMESQGYETWTNVVGIRSDEEHRIANIEKKEKNWISTFPLAFDDVTKADVLSFWKMQNFDLEVPDGFGNCEGCFLKSRAQLIANEQRKPGTLEWYARKEVQVGATFRSDRENYSKLVDFSQRQGTLNFTDDYFIDCACTD